MRRGRPCLCFKGEEMLWKVSEILMLQPIIKWAPRHPQLPKSPPNTTLPQISFHCYFDLKNLSLRDGRGARKIPLQECHLLQHCSCEDLSAFPCSSPNGITFCSPACRSVPFQLDDHIPSQWILLLCTLNHPACPQSLSIITFLYRDAKDFTFTFPTSFFTCIYFYHIHPHLGLATSWEHISLSRRLILSSYWMELFLQTEFDWHSIDPNTQHR